MISTDRSVQPSSLTLVASCSANGNTYPIGPTASPSNTLAANATQVIWNPWEWEQIPGQVPFAEATYVLQMYDERGPAVGIKGGYLSPYSGTQFSMYRPGSYQSIAGEFGSVSLLRFGDRSRTFDAYTSYAGRRVGATFPTANRRWLEMHDLQRSALTNGRTVFAWIDAVFRVDLHLCMELCPAISGIPSLRPRVGSWKRRRNTLIWAEPGREWCCSRRLDGLLTDFLLCRLFTAVL